MATIIVPNGEMETKMTKMDINLFHNITHFSEKYLRGTANRNGITFTGKLKECIHCARSKAKRIKIKKKCPTQHATLVKGQQLMYHPQKNKVTSETTMFLPRQMNSVENYGAPFTRRKVTSSWKG